MTSSLIFMLSSTVNNFFKSFAGLVAIRVNIFILLCGRVRKTRRTSEDIKDCGKWINSSPIEYHIYLIFCLYIKKARVAKNVEIYLLNVDNKCGLKRS